ncbi:MAG: FecR family protein [Bacteroidota bacterium]
MNPWETDDTFLSRWLNDQLTAEELKAFQASPDYQDYVATAQSLDTFDVGTYDAQAALKTLNQRIEEAKNATPVRRLQPLWYYAAAAAIVLLIVGVWLVRNLDGSNMQEYIAQQAQQVDLPDGTRIDLQAGSTLRYDAGDWENNRKVSLEGEAYFDVAKGKKFDIQLPQGSVRILGTRFHITESPDTLAVVCYEGRVQVHAFGKEAILTAGRGLLATQDGIPRLDTTSLIQPLWLSDNVNLKNVTLGDALAQLSEIYKVTFEGIYEADMILSNVNFPVNDLQTALAQVLGSAEKAYTLDTSDKRVQIK